MASLKTVIGMRIQGDRNLSWQNILLCASVRNWKLAHLRTWVFHGLFLQLAFLAAGLYAQPDYAAYESILAQHVTAEGKVDYTGLKKELPSFRKVVADMTARKPDDTWSREEQMAFWINTYNAYTLLVVTAHYPVGSILDIDNGETWKVAQAVVGGRNYTLDEIEHEVLRSRYHDPRIHFAINCAAASCPPLMNSAYRPARLEQQLDDRTRLFIHSRQNEITPFKARLSELFRWYASDFGDVPAYINRYASTKLTPGSTISYIPYDWSLND